MASKKGEAAFFAAHDKRIKVPKKIQAALDVLLKEGKDRWEYDADFRKLTGVGPHELKAYRAQFAKHLVWAPTSNGRKDSRLTWCATSELAAKFAKVPGAEKYNPQDDKDDTEE